MIPDEHFLSGHSGHVAGVRALSRARVLDTAAHLLDWARLRPLRLERAARRLPRRRVLVLAIERPDVPGVLDAALRELARSRHQVEAVVGEAGSRGKFENLERMLAGHPAAGHDWLLVVDDDVSLPRGFLDRFLYLAERFDLAVAQPAHRALSHAAWTVTRRQARSVVRETGFVEIGPVFAFHSRAFPALLPFPPLRVGWGLELHWSAVARAHGLRLGVVDAVAVGHGLRPVASAYDRSGAVAEAREFLSGHAYVPAGEAARTLAVHRSWRR